MLLLATFASTIIAYAAANDALTLNPPNADAHITVRGSDWLWAAFSVLLASAIGMTVLALFQPLGHRAFHWIGAAICFTASVAYFAMASDLGATPVLVEFVRYSDHLFTNRDIDPYTRQVWYARYIDWTITTPLLLLELLLATGLPLSDILFTIFMDLVMIIAGLVGSLVVSRYKWGFFAGATVAQFFIVYMLLFPGRASAKAIGAAAYDAYVKSAILLCIVWIGYPIAWGVADGGNVISPDSEMIFYGVLDLVAKPVFLFFHLFNLRSVEYSQFQLESGHFSVGREGYNLDKARRQA